MKQVENAYRAVISYNIGCCFNRMNMIPECIEALKEAVSCLEQDPSALKIDSVETKVDS